jgi:hypothetical protein
MAIPSPDARLPPSCVLRSPLNSEQPQARDPHPCSLFRWVVPRAPWVRCVACWLLQASVIRFCPTVLTSYALQGTPRGDLEFGPRLVLPAALPLPCVC